MNPKKDPPPLPGESCTSRGVPLSSRERVQALAYQLAEELDGVIADGSGDQEAGFRVRDSGYRSRSDGLSTSFHVRFDDPRVVEVELRVDGPKALALARFLRDYV